MATLSETPSDRLELGELDFEATASVPDIFGETPVVRGPVNTGLFAEAANQVGRLFVMTALEYCSRHDMSGCCDCEQVTGTMQEHRVVKASEYNNKVNLCINVPKEIDH